VGAVGARQLPPGGRVLREVCVATWNSFSLSIGLASSALSCRLAVSLPLPLPHPAPSLLVDAPYSLDQERNLVERLAAERGVTAPALWLELNRRQGPGLGTGLAQTLWGWPVWG
jgi:hypothetical protein